MTKNDSGQTLVQNDVTNQRLKLTIAGFISTKPTSLKIGRKALYLNADWTTHFPC